MYVHQYECIKSCAMVLRFRFVTIFNTERALSIVAADNDSSSNNWHIATEFGNSFNVVLSFNELYMLAILGIFA